MEEIIEEIIQENIPDWKGMSFQQMAHLSPSINVENRITRLLQALAKESGS